MAVYVTQNQDLFLKLSAISTAFKITFAKLYSYQKALFEERRKDREYYQLYFSAYLDSQEDLYYTDLFTNVSYEVDNILMGMENKDED